MMKGDWWKITLVILLGLLTLHGSGCTLIREFPRRSELTLRTRAANSINDGAERSAESTLELKGNNRDILAAYKTALEFSLEKLGLLKK